ncbi:membrane protein [Chlorobiota bacterium]|nr:membrane protein [Chlorobiota bacterium]
MIMKSNKIVYWVLTGLISLVFIGSALGKLTVNEESLKMASNFGIDSATFTMLGILELACLFLFIIPRTGIIGTMLLAAYMGGAIATHVEHGESILAPCIVQSILFLIAFYRFPELRSTLLDSKS